MEEPGILHGPKTSVQRTTAGTPQPRNKKSHSKGEDIQWEMHADEFAYVTRNQNQESWSGTQDEEGLAHGARAGKELGGWGVDAERQRQQGLDTTPQLSNPREVT